ncbi:hypothetical protein [Sinomonas humi]|uniref:Uncharacterized protein n=1 Tax=Sinomonas humi TaxID=1338436 RepID=A0A0B2ART2_9MICC|nr:hypothetical protein [Sinomonas humi]KHL04712.1 hypothetical protein LK10_04245 [Sinomonas humi]
MTWNEDGGLTVARVSTDPRGEQVKGEIRAPLEEWLNIVVGVLAMLPGKPDPTGQGYVLGPANADPDMIGALIAAKLKERPSYRGGNYSDPN